MHYEQPDKKMAGADVTEAAVFCSVLDSALVDPAHSASVLVDGIHEVRFPEIPKLLAALNAQLRAMDIRPGDCLLLEPPNNVPAAITVLALIYSGTSFMTMPPVGLGTRAGGNDIGFPSFCRWRVTFASSQSSQTVDMNDAGSFLSVDANPGFDADCSVASVESPKLFFRTSGSLGSAKVAVHGYRKFYENVRAASRHIGMNPRYRIAMPTPIFHLYGLELGLLGGVIGGASIDIQERGNLLRFLEREEQFAPNVAMVTPTFCEVLVRGRRSSRPYELMISSGDRIGESTFRRSEEKHGPMISGYGSTEMGFIAGGLLSDDQNTRCHTVGRPMNGVEVRIVNQNSEGVGELQVQHPYAFERYVDMRGQSLNLPNIHDGPWYRTGDLACAGPEGTIRVLGRADLSVNRNGVLLPFADVENRLRELDGVEEAAVTVGPDTIRGRAIVAFCVLSRGSQISGADLRNQYAQRAPAFAVPESIQVLSSLPKLENGKIDRVSLAKMAEQVSL